jgi:hypothetical protein
MEQKGSIQKAWLIGAAIIVLIVAGDIAARRAGLGGEKWMLYAVWSAFMVAVFISTTLSPKHKLVTGMSHTLTISLLFAISNWVQFRTGTSVDLGGDKGFGIVFALIYVTGFIPALIAAGAGLLLSGRKNSDLFRK